VKSERVYGHRHPATGRVAFWKLDTMKTQILGLRAEVKNESEVLVAAIRRFQGVLNNSEIFDAITIDERAKVVAGIAMQLRDEAVAFEG
jgi:hypothetical protein